MTGDRTPDVVVFDYGTGNVHSAVKALEAAGANVELTGNRARALEADGLLAVAEAGATAVIQPGGSMNDQKVIDAADEAGLAMVFTGMRHFLH